MADVDVSQLPWEVREQLAQLDLELSEGDITTKGYEKKRYQLISKFAAASCNAGKQLEPTRF
ncbi:unnamed protein product [Soboliphyme baturini]|uniref:DMAP-interaction domain-containing protein n=1 Tax=Soboliphyme baturini TaxID=241478 RepID=A0A183JAQ5_9BILA|nr:unnamed protein product [Soboliphyme baturini]